MVSIEVMFGALLAGTVVAVLLARWPRLCGWVCAALVAVAGAASVWLGALALGDGVEMTLGSLRSLPSSLTLHFTPLNMVFVWLILGLGLLASVYSVGYVTQVARRDAGGVTAATLRYWPAFMLFLASMIAAICISDMLFFFIAWSFMALPAFVLIIHDVRNREVLRAGLKFLVFTIAGNIAIFAAVMILYRVGGDFSFETATATMGALLATRPWLAHLTFGLLALGFLTKLGIYPMGDWLPDAHPAAPSPVSALLSGVMIKLGAYDIAHTSIAMMVDRGASESALMAWGLGLAALGGLSVLLGGAAAAGSNDTKRLLAYSSVGQSGYILMCLGLSMAFVRVAPGLGGLGFVAAMAFIIADGVHKSLLFLTAGSVLHATGTRDLVQLGGLGERMPATTGAAIAGALSVGGLPLSAGFIGKWLLFQTAFLAAAVQPVVALYLLVIVVGSILSLAYALKYVGAAYLGAPAGRTASEAREVPVSMRIPQMMLALGAVAAGIWPGLLVQPALTAWAGSVTAPIEEIGGALLTQSPGGVLTGGFIPPVVLALVAIAALMAWGLSRLAGAPSRVVPSWQSGLDLPLAHTRLPASGWYWPFTPVLRRVYREIPFPRLGVPEVREGTAEAVSASMTWYRQVLAAQVRHTLVWPTAGAVVVLLLLLAFWSH